MRRSGRPEDLTGEAVLEFDRLTIDDHLSGPGGRPVASGTGTVGHVCGERD